MRQMKAELIRFNLEAFTAQFCSQLVILFHWTRREVIAFTEAFARRAQFNLKQTDCTGASS
ncbi:hypothetical protein Q669_15825 [Labrenzia sp. C1B10]|nr:hypothetical protein Q669_15825 [Labrenzia sp. C1B10]